MHDFIPGDESEEFVPGDAPDEPGRSRSGDSSDAAAPSDEDVFIVGEDDEVMIMGEPEEAPKEPSAEPPLPSGQDPVARRERIREVTRRGGFSGSSLPDGFLADGDWRCAEADDPFERLFLDVRQHEAISDSMVARHAMLLKAFWEKRVRVVESGSPQQVREFVDTYGGGSRARLMAYPGDVQRSADRLASPEQRRQVAEQVLAKRRAAMREHIRRALRDELLTAGEARDLIELDGAALGLEPDEVTGLILDELDALGFRPALAPGQPEPGDPLSVQWLSEDEYRSWRTRQETRADVPLLIGDGSAFTLDELVTLCDEQRREAAQAFLDGHIEPWLARLGQTPLAREAKAAREREEPGGHRFERFVRAVAQTTGRPATPVLQSGRDQLAPGALPQGATRATPLPLHRQGPRRAWGTIDVEGTLPGLHVPRTFTLDDEAVDVRIDTLRVAPGRYEGALVVRPEGGTPVRVPVAYTVVPVTVEMSSPELALGRLKYNRVKEVELSARPSPSGGRIVGSAEIEPEHAGVTVRGVPGLLTVAINTAAFAAGDTYRGAVKLDTNVGEVTVPLSFRVRVAWGRALLWAVVFAAGLGAALGYFRGLAAEASSDLRSFAVSGTGGEWWIPIVLLVVIAGAWRLTRALYRGPKPRKEISVVTDE